WLLLRIGLARPVQATHAAVVPLKDEIDVRIVGAFGSGARADLEIEHIALRLVDEMMTVGNSGLEARAVAGLEHGLAAVLYQGDFAFEHIDELVLLLVPMPQR